MKSPAMDKAKRFLNILAPDAKKADDGRDVWQSRASFIFAAMGGAIGLGNLLRFPSIVFRNSGLQWFIPYLIALSIIAIPVLTLEISIGQTYRSGNVVAFNKINRRLRGMGLAIILNGYFVVIYYITIIAWIMRYFQGSFQSPLPWTEDGRGFFENTVVANVPVIPAVYSGPNNTGSVVEYATYPGTGMVGHTVGWVAFSWFVVWLCMFKGVGLTGRVVYFTIGIPIVTVIILMGRSLSMDNAKAGVELYFAEWHGSKLADGQIWREALGQIFFSIGVGFGYFVSYASYNAKQSNAVQDAVVIACSNSLFEVIAAFAVFGVIGYLDLQPGESLGTFTVAFLTYPEAIIAMPGSNFWAILFFVTIFLLGLSSAFALTEAIVTGCCDTDWGKKIPRWMMSTGWIIFSFLLSLMYCTEFGLDFLDAVDSYVNNLSLFFVVWCECILPTMLYRYKDVIHEVGLVPWIMYNFGHIGAQCIGVGIGHGVDPVIGAIVGFAIFIVFTVGSLLLAKTPTADTPGFFGRNPILRRFFWLGFYSGNQLTRDLNVIVGQGKNWNIPVVWGPVLRYLSAPILAIVFGFSYGVFYQQRGNPLHIFGFTVCHMIMAVLLFSIAIPSWLNFLVAPISRNADKLQYSTSPGVTVDDRDAAVRAVQDPMDMDVGLDRSSDGQEKKV